MSPPATAMSLSSSGKSAGGDVTSTALPEEAERLLVSPWNGLRRCPRALTRAAVQAVAEAARLHRSHDGDDVGTSGSAAEPKRSSVGPRSPRLADGGGAKAEAMADGTDGLIFGARGFPATKAVGAAGPRPTSADTVSMALAFNPEESGSKPRVFAVKP
mmetsp:Transcript_53315/g.128330  ORF Transcript_53315/g.128330 Transcript_53315/m.128330 type:complete len:159 (+) Transcript_53315:954-1430(+)